ncbi:transposase [Deinococcus sp. Arct2-2]|nr:transposase [Deinococcus sp. Arct2-2]
MADRGPAAPRNRGGQGGVGKKAITTPEKRVLVRELVTQRVKPERACFLVGLPKSSWHYRPKPCQDDEIRRRIRELAGQHPRRGSRFIHALLVKEGNKVNRKKVRRIWREEWAGPNVWTTSSRDSAQVQGTGCEAERVNQVAANSSGVW